MYVRKRLHLFGALFFVVFVFVRLGLGCVVDGLHERIPKVQFLFVVVYKENLQLKRIREIRPYFLLSIVARSQIRELACNII